MMKTVIITGGIGSGKSEVCRYLRSKGVPVYNADTAVKKLYCSNKTLFPSIEKALGKELRDEKGEMDFSALAGIIFSSPQALEKVEAIVHPALLEDFLKWKEEKEAQVWCRYSRKEPFVIMESAIVLEKPLFAPYYDAAIMVEAPERLRISRTMSRDGAGEAQIRNIMSLQNIDREKVSCIINNDSGLDVLHARTDEAFANLKL